MVTRRAAIALLAGGLAEPGALLAQAKLPVIGLLWNDSVKPSRHRALLVGALRDLGYIEDRDLRFIDRIRFGELYGRMQEGADDLARAGVDLIVAFGGTATLSAARATKAIPIVAITGVDLVAAGLARSYARPGGNVTGVATLSIDLVAKRVQLVQELVRGMSRLGLIFAAESSVGAAYLRETEEAARRLKLQTRVAEVRRPEDIDGAIADLAGWPAEAMLVVPSSMLSAHSRAIAGLARKHRIPSVGATLRFAQEGGVLSYSADERAQFAHAATYIQRILKGARPGDLPIDRASRFELAVNLATAKAIGIPVPQSILTRADRTFE